MCTVSVEGTVLPARGHEYSTHMHHWLITVTHTFLTSHMLGDYSYTHLLNQLQPFGDAIKCPLICDIIHQHNTLRVRGRGEECILKYIDLYNDHSSII